ncbi:13613_t:CDS:2 [Funneliformis geosporum]|uniref:11499_t:CDS:1 n=1 Tax=Funneliformis geosporum TaxID=1117311 RepID=A0A9W4WLS5_9GLOM|nr:13613_t:CDS:2 [Funneliformis geosporum]CAI2171515.1 11499_t:CDS:2 [Funneliformis geosporum]
MTKVGKTILTNRIDDILISEGHELLRQINAKEKRDRLCWSWIMYCSRYGNSCQLIEVHRIYTPLNIIINSTPKVERLNL